MINIYFNYNGNARDVINFYRDVFDAEAPQLMTFEDFPESDPSHKDWISHGLLIVNDQQLMFSDTMPNEPAEFGSHITLLIASKSEEDLRRWFSRLNDEAKIIMDLGPTFFSPLYGALVDKYHTTWQFYLESDSH